MLCASHKIIMKRALYSKAPNIGLTIRAIFNQMLGN